MELYIRDNSRTTQIDLAQISHAGFFNTLLDHDGSNQALGSVYRNFTAKAKGLILFFLDDDTDISQEYVNEATESLEPHLTFCANVLCVPRIYNKQNQIYSPSEYRVFRGKLFPKIAPGRYSNLNAIMSGLAVPRYYLASMGPSAFSTRSRLYSVDTMFMCAHAKKKGITIVCKSKISHDLSRDSQRRPMDELRRSWLEAIGIFWTVINYRKPWIPALPLYLIYFASRRLVLAFRLALAR
jgi:hypothetical protein